MIGRFIGSGLLQNSHNKTVGDICRHCLSSDNNVDALLRFPRHVEHYRGGFV